MFIAYTVFLPFLISSICSLRWKDSGAIITSPDLLCYDINVYVSKTLLSTIGDYNRMKNDIGKILLSAKKAFAWHRIELRVNDVVFFEKADPFYVTSNYNQIMDEFAYFIASSYEKADAYVLLIDKPTTEPNVVGKAFLGTACTNNAIAVVQAGDQLQFDAGSIGRAIAHELGHILNMDHVTDRQEGCRCAFENDSCIMSYKLFQWDNPIDSPAFHSCSVQDALAEDYECLKKCNNGIIKFDTCGDGVKNKLMSPRSCDCGTKETCNARGASMCCDHTRCLLAYNAQCSEEVCCKNCQFTPGKVCRRMNGECDLTEYCSFSSGECPEDISVYNGKPCGNSGYCFDGICQDKDQVCQKLFKKSINVRYSNKCYDFIQFYERSGRCESSAAFDPYTAESLICNSARDPCLNIWCEMDEIKDPAYYVLEFTSGFNRIKCYTADNTAFHVPNGFVCGNDRICYNGICSDIENHKTSCPICPPGKVCSNKGTCVPQA